MLLKTKKVEMLLWMERMGKIETIVSALDEQNEIETAETPDIL